MHQVILPKSTSDHFLILLQSKEVPSVKRPFKFENMWLEAEGFSDLMKSFWGELNVSGFPSFLLAKKLKFLKLRLKDGMRKSLATLTLRWLIWWRRLSFLMRSNNEPFLKGTKLKDRR